MASNTTPMMRQYTDIKAQNSDCILFFRLGDFYEMFGDDARLVSKELELTLTTRDRGVERDEDKVPMCGVPYHSAESYIARLIERGYKVAICEQTEDPALAKGLVRREVVRIITPGTVIESSMLEDTRNNFLCAVFVDGGTAGLCFADVSTGEAYATQFPAGDQLQEILAETGRFVPREALLSPEAYANQSLVSFLQDKLRCLVAPGPPDSFDHTSAQEKIAIHYEKSLFELGLSDKPAAICALGGVLAYLYQTQKGRLELFSSLNVYENGKFMEIDMTARRHLELCESLRGGKKGSLLAVLDRTGTAMGGRLLRSFLEKPLCNPAEITRRLRAVEELVTRTEWRGEWQTTLRGLPDMERLIGKVVYGTAGGRDMRALHDALATLPAVEQLLGQAQSSLLKESALLFDPLPELRELIDKTIRPDPPHGVREGGFIRNGFHPDVDRLRALMTNAKGLVASLETEERQKTGIKNLKIGYNKVFGYYIEISKSNLALAPDHYIRKQTLAGCERFITEPLKKMEYEILHAQERVIALESSLFEELRDTLTVNAPRIQRAARVVALCDALFSLAETAAVNRYVCPVVDFSDTVDIRDGRHSIVERLQQDTPFVPNDTLLTKEYPVAIITGPNMAGKSTYMRQTALIVIMAQMGSFVPAASARIGAVDRVFTRIGAQDDLAGGRSTFMVEMSEVADILRFATPKSLIILDEVGRGTSTFDGMSVARAVLEHVADSKLLGAKTLFATHYHELTVLESDIPGVRNYNVAVKKRGNEIVFLRKIVPGGADDSYGVEVAALAGLPAKLIRRAEEILNGLESGAASLPAAPESPRAQMGFDDITALAIANRLKSIAPDALTPIEALTLLYDLHRQATKGE